MVPFIRPFGQVLVIEDDCAVAELYREVLTRAGLEVSLACDGEDGVEKALLHPPDLVLLDLSLPNLDGVEVCKRLKAEPATHLVPVLILSGSDPMDRRLGAWEAGADEYLMKPVRAVDLIARVRSLLRMKGILDELDSAHAALFAFTRAVEAKCPSTLGHTERVTDYALRLADAVGLPPHEREALRRGAVLHDIGKISTPDAVLNKPAKLTEGEFAVIRRHPVEGVRILEPLRSLKSAIPFVRWHHERGHGRGYPDGLHGDEIPLGVRILSVADVFDALSSDRPYRRALSFADSLTVMKDDARDGGLDPDLVECFAGTLDRTEELCGF